MSFAIPMEAIGQPVRPQPFPHAMGNCYALAAEFDISPELARHYALGAHASAEGKALEEIRCRRPAEAWFAAGWHDHQMGRVIL